MAEKRSVENQNQAAPQPKKMPRREFLKHLFLSGTALMLPKTGLPPLFEATKAVPPNQETKNLLAKEVLLSSSAVVNKYIKEYFHSGLQPAAELQSGVQAAVSDMEKELKKPEAQRITLTVFLNDGTDVNARSITFGQGKILYYSARQRSVADLATDPAAPEFIHHTQEIDSFATFMSQQKAEDQFITGWNVEEDFDKKDVQTEPPKSFLPSDDLKTALEVSIEAANEAHGYNGPEIFSQGSTAEINPGDYPKLRVGSKGITSDKFIILFSAYFRDQDRNIHGVTELRTAADLRDVETGLTFGVARINKEKVFGTTNTDTSSVNLQRIDKTDEVVPLAVYPNQPNPKHLLPDAGTILNGDENIATRAELYTKTIQLSSLGLETWDPLQ